MHWPASAADSGRTLLCCLRLLQGFGYDTIDKLFESAAALGLTVGRTWAMNYGMPEEPGGGSVLLLVLLSAACAVGGGWAWCCSVLLVLYVGAGPGAAGAAGAVGRCQEIRVVSKVRGKLLGRTQCCWCCWKLQPKLRQCSVMARC
jgi:hypothetical protein